MDTRLYILAGTFLLLILSIIYLLIASFRAARIKRSMYEPTFVIDSPALTSAEIIVELEPDERDARFAPPSSDVYAAMQEPLRTGSWRPDHQEVDPVAEPTEVDDAVSIDVASEEPETLDIEDTYVAELIGQLQDDLEATETEAEVETAVTVQPSDAQPVPEPSVAPAGGEDYWTRLISEQERLVQDHSQERAVSGTSVGVEIPDSGSSVEDRILYTDVPPEVSVPESTLAASASILVEVDEPTSDPELTFAVPPVEPVPEPVYDPVSVSEPEERPEPVIPAEPEPVTPARTEPVIPTQPDETPLAPAVSVQVSMPQPAPVVERPSALVSRELEVESRPRARVSESVGVSPEDSPPLAEPISPPLRTHTPAQAAVRAAVSDRALVAPVEMWFGDFRIGVKAGTRTYEQFRRYADVILRDLDASERARGLR